MGIAAHGSLTVVPPGSHRRVAVAGPGVVPGLCVWQRLGPAPRVATATVGGTGESHIYEKLHVRSRTQAVTKYLDSMHRSATAVP